MNIKWEEGAPVPVGHYNHTAVWLNGLVYVGGGIETGGGASYIINRYDPVNDSWSSSINSPYSHFAMTTLNGKLITAGGEDKNGQITNQILTMSADCLKTYAKMIKVRSHATAAGYQGMLIIAGGWDEKYKRLSSTELFDSNNGQWYKCTDIPQPYYWLQSVIVGNILYLLSGFNKDGYSSPAVFTASLDTLSAHQLKWNTHQDTPWRLSAPVNLNGLKLLVVGGGKSTYTSKIYKFNKVTNNWEAIGHLPSPRSRAAVVSTANNRIIAIGGWDDKRVVTNTVWIGSFEPHYLLN